MPINKDEIEARVREMDCTKVLERRTLLNNRIAAAKKSESGFYQRHLETWHYELAAIDHFHGQDFNLSFEI